MKCNLKKGRPCHAYLVEGFTDVMIMHQCDIYNVIASQGTAICSEQAALLRKLCTHVTILVQDAVYRREYLRRGCEVLAVEKEVLSFGFGIEEVLSMVRQNDGDRSDGYRQNGKK